MVYLSQLLPLSHFPLLSKEVQLRLFFLLKVLEFFFILFIVLHQHSSFILFVCFLSLL